MAQGVALVDLLLVETCRALFDVVCRNEKLESTYSLILSQGNGNETTLQTIQQPQRRTAIAYIW